MKDEMMEESKADKIRIAKRILGVGSLAALAITLVVSAIGFLFGWRSSAHFSDGCTITGALIFLLGWLFMIPLPKKENKGVLEPSGSVRIVDEDAKKALLISDLTKGKRLFALCTWISTLLILFGILIYSLIH